MRSSGVLFLFLAVFGVTLAFRSYSGYQIWHTAPLTRDDLIKLTSLLRNPKYEMWKVPSVGREALIRSPPQYVQELQDELTRLNLQPELFIEDLEVYLSKQREENDAVKRKEINGLNRNVTFDRFMNLTEIMEYIDEVAVMYPQLATLEIIGQSYEGRPLKLLKISTNSGPKPIVFVNAGIHASEWPGEAMALYCINQLTEFAAINQEMLDLADWYILTVSNPDGYEFSWTDVYMNISLNSATNFLLCGSIGKVAGRVLSQHIVSWDDMRKYDTKQFSVKIDRAWRKTRRPNNGTTCVGTDPNRNFDIHWGEGGETDPCLWNYPGPNPYSESEIRALADYITALGETGRLELYMDVHTPGARFSASLIFIRFSGKFVLRRGVFARCLSYLPFAHKFLEISFFTAVMTRGWMLNDQYLIHPYGYTLDLPPQYVITAADEAALAVEAVRGTHYLVGNTWGTYVFMAYGDSEDFAFAVANATYAYTWELPLDDPPPSEIRPYVEETWPGFQVLVRHAAGVASKSSN